MTFTLLMSTLAPFRSLRSSSLTQHPSSAVIALLYVTILATQTQLNTSMCSGYSATSPKQPLMVSDPPLACLGSLSQQLMLF